MKEKKSLLTQIRKLQRENERLQRLSTQNFRDLAPFGEEWELLASISPERKKEMEAWLRGPAMVVGSPLTEDEKYVLKGREVTYKACETFNFDTLVESIREAEEKKVSHLYLPVNAGFAEALNKLLKDYNLRVCARRYAGS